MSVLDIMKERYSAREYLDRKVEKEKIDIILEAARVAPTGCNFQPFKIVVVESEEGLKAITLRPSIFSTSATLLVKRRAR